MASNKNKSKKRLARAKVKPTDSAEAGSGKSKRASAASRTSGDGSSFADRKAKASAKQQKTDRKKLFTTVGIIIFAVVMALSMMLPSLAPIFASQNASSQQAAEEQSTSTSDESSSDTSTESSTEQSATSQLDANYTKTITPLEKKLEGDPQNLAALLNLGNEYMNWGYSASYSGSDAEHSKELLTKAMGYYDRYLALNDSPAVKVNRALCQLYSGDTAGAQAALEQLTQTNADYGPAWANLGLTYEMAANQDAAKAAYEKAQEVDANDEYGAKSFADRRLVQMNNTGTELNGDSGVSSTDKTTGLSDALNGSGGTGR
jgi:Tfp pilus assembly protein PilF